MYSEAIYKLNGVHFVQYDRIMGHTKDVTINKVIFKHETLDTDIVSPGEMLLNKQTMINKEMPAVMSAQ